jgi:hypothetical protein
MYLVEIAETVIAEVDFNEVLETAVLYLRLVVLNNQCICRVEVLSSLGV